MMLCMAGDDAVCDQEDAVCDQDDALWGAGRVCLQNQLGWALCSQGAGRTAHQVFWGPPQPCAHFPPSSAPHPISVLILSVSGCL